MSGPGGGLRCLSAFFVPFLLSPQKLHFQKLCWRFLPVKGEFFFFTVTICLFSKRDCCEVAETMQTTIYCFCPGGVNPASQ